ncbi:helix-turn-helix domain-containing protein [Nocardia blacklockiae]|uniref:helix-turn-helix domain-containing protein n=1 Tax=Nocardia blacklockiae TaxID=480036 RepID=UPI0018949CCA|nr:helix-turn-helix transcriptional regulator [Nocardia blacklockiae]MBF6174102.1 helix-turn-helix domain-containing protein [Nocardia blacklockiae]
MNRGTANDSAGRSKRQPGNVADELAREIRRLRLEAGLSQRALAARVGYSRQYVSMTEWEDATLPSQELVAALDTALGADGALIALRAHVQSDVQTRRRAHTNALAVPAESEDTFPISRHGFVPPGNSGVLEFDEVRRRDFGTAIMGLPILAAGDMTLGRTLAHMGAVTGNLVAPELVDYFRTQLSGHYTADMYLGPLYLIPTVQSQTELIAVLAREAEMPVRRGLLETGTAYAALLGWLYQDVGDLTASAEWRVITLSLAHRCGDPQMISYALSNMAMLAVDHGDGRAVVDYAQAALAAGRELSPKARAIALQHQAQGHALLGDRAAADTLLDDLAALVGRVDDTDPWGNACRRTPHHVEVQRAACYGRTGSTRDAAAAVALWDEVIDSIPESARRDKAVFRARQATALAKIPDPDRAVWAASDAAGAVATTGSARLRSELKALPSHAHAWADTSAGQELRALVGSLA